MNTERPKEWNWHNVPDCAGILAIRHIIMNKAYFVAVSDLRQRAYDHHRLLSLGIHHNKHLQADWIADPTLFEIVAAEKVHCKAMLPLFKQVWLERHLNSYNRKNAIPRKATR